MTRLDAELQRLYPLPVPGAAGSAGVRGLVLELGRPADWEALGRVWRGVQADLQLPAPAIAVSGLDGMQLWFSLLQPVPPAEAASFLARLCAHYLPGVAPTRLRTTPSTGGVASPLPAVPAQQPGLEQWSAFVAPDLAPVFVDTPWLDIAPGAEGQADLLAGLQSIKPAAFDAALRRLPPVAKPAPTAQPAEAPPGRPAEATADLDPRQFLQRVLNDETAPLALRVDAAKVLLRR